jgi:hypothetical protein
VAKISDAQRAQYVQKIGFYQKVIDSILKREQAVLSEIEKEPEQAPLKKIALVDAVLDLTSNYMVQSGVSEALMRVKNENALNEGRKAIYRSIIYLEDIVTNWVDVPFADYKDKLATIQSVSAADRYTLIQKLGLTIQLIENAYGDNSKWKWSFVDLEGRFATIVRNLFDMENMIVNMDTRSPNYEPTVHHLRTIKRLLSTAADRYREKYELSSRRADDFRAAITFLNALRRLHILLSESGEAEMIKKKSDAWSAKFEADSKDT